MVEKTSAQLPKRGPGRPRVYANGTTVISFRVPTERARGIIGLIASIKLVEARCGDSDGTVLGEALEQRLRGLSNRSPAVVEDTLRKWRRIS